MKIRRRLSLFSVDRGFSRWRWAPWEDGEKGLMRQWRLMVVSRCMGCLVLSALMAGCAASEQHGSAACQVSAEQFPAPDAYHLDLWVEVE